MKQIELPAFGIENLHVVEVETPDPGAGQVLVRFGGASINYRDYQIVVGEFAPNQPLPIVPLSDGAGEIVAVGDGVTRFKTGDRVAPLFFPHWISGHALGDGPTLRLHVVALPSRCPAVRLRVRDCCGGTGGTAHAHYFGAHECRDLGVLVAGRHADRVGE